jgi:hypothetical protein
MPELVSELRSWFCRRRSVGQILNFLLSDNYLFLHAGHPLWRKDGSPSEWVSDLIYDRQSQSHITTYIWVGQPVLASGAHLGPETNFAISLRFSSRQLLFVMLYRLLWREDGSVTYCSCWSSPAQSPDKRSGLSFGSLSLLSVYNESLFT